MRETELYGVCTGSAFASKFFQPLRLLTYCVVETLRDENDAALDRRRLILEGAGKAFLR